MKNREITVLSDLEELSHSAAREFVRIANEKVKTGCTLSVALAGGSTPKRLYELLADEKEPYRSAVNWRNINFFWSDERCVPPDSEESNFRMANEILLKPLGIPSANIYRLKGESEPKTAADEYERLLRLIFNVYADVPQFDLILLGMGSDGHTASLFPQSDVLLENGKLVASSFVKKFGQFRLTLTPSVINRAANIIFLVSGADKASALHELLEGNHNPEMFPANRESAFGQSILDFRRISGTIADT
jgi:6-phosphogluconolactonase